MKAWIAAAILAGAGTASAAVQPPQPGAVQQQFDAATAALDAGAWPEALRLLEALETRVRNPRSLAIVRTRKATVLIELGRLDEATEALRVSLPLLPADDPSLSADRYSGLLALGGIAERRFDYAEALRQYRLAVAVPVSEIDKLTARRGLIQTQLFSDPEAALREADAALAVLAAAAPRDRALQGSLQTLKGRALLNLARFAEARVELERSTRLLGDLTLRVDRADLLARSDLALAALLSHREDDARRYLAYTGAGRFERGALELTGLSEIPRCGGDLVPEDVAVIQAGVADDGSVAYAMPIYASRRGASALAFARAVANWSFDRESVARIPPFLRSVARFELRCTTVAPRDVHAENSFAAPARMAAADPAWETMLRRLSIGGLVTLRQELAALDRAAAPDPHSLLPVLVMLSRHGSVPRDEREMLLRRALPLAARQPNSAPLVASIALAIGFERSSQGPRTRRDRPDFDALLAMPEVRDSPRAGAEIRLAQGRRLFADKEDARALALAAAVRDMPGLTRDDPLRAQALELIVAVQAARGDVAGARAAHEAIGPRARPCGLWPRQTGFGVSDADFPRDALRWGFEGWGMNELSVAADGSVAEARTLVAYPAFVFGAAASCGPPASRTTTSSTWRPPRSISKFW